ncbi:hypothetical protein Ae201684_013335 [Aphanomyces euteiches]|uniref:Leucine-rich repeat-containing N-terminal plant-type domain-containing protein n=1 Tax=Aphanomyces euteiches TaxID=100861 RepID=A0A6G0WNT4_9STRA|nr:hypothetical protein Ae201684_013335 [Aphanomyces euteiches]
MLRVLVTWSAVASAKCIYDTLPPSVNLTLVWNFSYCKSSKSASCYVNRSCVEQQKPVKSFEAIGDFSDSPDTDGHMNGYDKVYDWSLFIAPPNMISYTLNGYPRIELSPTFKWPPRLANLALDGNLITTLPPLPPTLTSLSVASTAIISLENLDFSNLTFLDISSTPLKTIKNVTFSSKMFTLEAANSTTLSMYLLFIGI